MVAKYKNEDLIENVQDLIFILDSSGKTVFVNQRLVTVTGIPKSKWIGKNLLDFLVKEDIAVARTNFKSALAGQAKTFEMRFPGPDGGIYFSTNMNPIFEAGSVTGVIAIARDISEQKKLEQEIIELKNFNESIIQSMQAGLITLDLNQTITSLNSGAEEVLDLNAKETVGRKIDEIFQSEQVHDLLTETDSTFNTPPNREMNLKLRTGRQVHIGYTVTPRLDDQGKRAGTIISFKDISQIKSMQAEMIRMDRLASLGVLASGIAHEIKNPLAGIKTMAQTLDEDLDDKDPHREYLRRIVRQVNRLDDILKNFFIYARPKPPVRKPYRLQEIVRDVFTLVKQKMLDKNIEFSQSFTDALPDVLVDAAQIQQVLINLILNAIDAIDKHGVIGVAAKPKRTSLRAVGRRRTDFPKSQREALFVEMSIHDTGCGIEQKNLKRIFDPFFTTKSSGTGLGLSMVYRILAANGGEINVESTLGSGTTFTLLLPTEV